jgi:hypothetical protein
MDNQSDVTPRMKDLIRLFEEIRLKANLLGREGRDLLEKLERKLAAAEHRLREPHAPQQEIARILHELHEALGRLRERAAVEESRP